ncbi:MAG: DNA-directed RNA polymerase subunit alpha [Chlorobi bacterium]|nr:DNA-directed RNA polymerase subunit alpha [Chlorobiota bacterium]
MTGLKLDFQIPKEVTELEAKGNTARFEFKPLEPGFGLTIGNALRRVLLSALEGYAITSVRFQGVDHEFSTIDGVVEDVTSIVLNLKQIRFKAKSDDVESEKVHATLQGKEVYTAGDLQPFIRNFEILNPDLVLMTTDGKVKIDMVFEINKGRGYVTAEETKKPDMPFGTIFMDAIFSPIKHVNYSIENYRVGQKTDYERLIIEVTTDGSITPRKALAESAKILIKHFILFSDEKLMIPSDAGEEEGELDEQAMQMRALLKTKIEDLGIGSRSLNCLKAAEVNTLGDLVQYTKNDLLKLRNFGKKSLEELEKIVEEKGLSFGMDLSKYKLD